MATFREKLCRAAPGWAHLAGDIDDDTDLALAMLDCMAAAVRRGNEQANASDRAFLGAWGSGERFGRTRADQQAAR